MVTVGRVTPTAPLHAVTDAHLSEAVAAIESDWIGMWISLQQHAEKLEGKRACMTIKAMPGAICTASRIANLQTDCTTRATSRLLLKRQDIAATTHFLFTHFYILSLNRRLFSALKNPSFFSTIFFWREPVPNTY